MFLYHNLSCCGFSTGAACFPNLRSISERHFNWGGFGVYDRGRASRCTNSRYKSKLSNPMDNSEATRVLSYKLLTYLAQRAISIPCKKAFQRSRVITSKPPSYVRRQGSETYRTHQARGQRLQQPCSTTPILPPCPQPKGTAALHHFHHPNTITSSPHVHRRSGFPAADHPGPPAPPTTLSPSCAT
jgi:hypothetical protein